MTGALVLCLVLIGFLVLVLGYALYDSTRHPSRWLSGPSMDARDAERGQS